MAGEINTVPLGLLALLGLKEQGVNPPALGELVVPTMELSQFYQTQLTRIAQDTLSVTAAGGFGATSLIVPQNETWIVSQYMVLRQLGAGETLDLCAAWVIQGQGFQVGNYVAGVANNFVSAFQDRVLILPPGSQAAVFARSVTGAPLAVTLRCVYVPLRV